MTANTTHTPSDIDVQIIQGEAPPIYIYRVDRGELERLTSASNPMPLTISGIAIGAFFSLLPSVISGLTDLGSPAFGRSDLVYILGDAVALVGGLVAGTFAIRNGSAVKTVLDDIKRRAGG